MQATLPTNHRNTFRLFVRVVVRLATCLAARNIAAGQRRLATLARYGMGSKQAKVRLDTYTTARALMWHVSMDRRNNARAKLAWNARIIGLTATAVGDD